MATYVFDGTQNVSIEFDPAVDTLVLNVDLANIANVADTAAGVQLTTTTGAVLTLFDLDIGDLEFANVVGNGYVAVFANAAGDTIAVAGSDALVVGAEGFDTIDVTGDNEFVVFAHEGDDAITGDAEGARIYAGQGNDTVTGFDAGSLIAGGLGVDVIDASAALEGGVTVYGGNGQSDLLDSEDAVLGSTFADSLYGNAGDDLLDSNGGEDIVHGGAGNDTVLGGEGATLYGGAGDDYINGDFNAPAVGADGVVVYGGNGISAAEDGDDDIFGTAGDDTLYGNGGNDAIDASQGGVDLIHAGAGDDVIVDFAEGSLVMGGRGEDVIGAALTVTGEGVTIYGGNEAADISDNNDWIIGSGGNDTIFGNGGDDIVLASADSVVFGGQGNDTLVAGVGNTQLTGGIGDDTFAVRTATAGDASATNYVTATDFSDGEDLLDFGGDVTGVASVGQPASTTETGIINALDAVATGSIAAVLEIESGENAGTWVGVEDGAGDLQVIKLENFTGTITTADFVAGADAFDDVTFQTDFDTAVTDAFNLTPLTIADFTPVP
ncbi:beta strand repeat-containing protein [Microvirga sp. GCM10011540]|uniref:beta strand repeat-containing protein n=1 Tax=Microvirga sp. GCM10011540 TaxID=3317338 RepID=UPI0036207336